MSHISGYPVLCNPPVRSLVLKPDSSGPLLWLPTPTIFYHLEQWLRMKDKWLIHYVYWQMTVMDAFHPIWSLFTWGASAWRWPQQRPVPAVGDRPGYAGWPWPGVWWGGPGAGGWSEGCWETPRSSWASPHTPPHSDSLQDKNRTRRIFTLLLSVWLACEHTHFFLELCLQVLALLCWKKLMLTKSRKNTVV